MVERYARFGVPTENSHKKTPSPEVVTLALDELSGSFASLVLQFPLLLAYPTQPTDGVGTGRVEACCGWGDQGDASCVGQVLQIGRGIKWRFWERQGWQG